MKTLFKVDDLVVIAFIGPNYEKNKDKFLIGECNANTMLFKDVVSGQIVDINNKNTIPLKTVASSNSLLRYTTNFNPKSATFLQKMIIRKIVNLVKTESFIILEDLEYIKDFMNKHIVKSYTNFKNTNDVNKITQ